MMKTKFVMKLQKKRRLEEGEEALHDIYSQNKKLHLLGCEFQVCVRNHTINPQKHNGYQVVIISLKNKNGYHQLGKNVFLLPL